MDFIEGFWQQIIASFSFCFQSNQYPMTIELDWFSMAYTAKIPTKTNETNALRMGAVLVEKERNCLAKDNKLRSQES